MPSAEKRTPLCGYELHIGNIEGISAWGRTIKKKKKALPQQPKTKQCAHTYSDLQ